MPLAMSYDVVDPCYGPLRKYFWTCLKSFKFHCHNFKRVWIGVTSFLFYAAAGLTANGMTPMKDGLLMALQEIGKNGEPFTAGYCLTMFFFPFVPPRSLSSYVTKNSKPSQSNQDRIKESLRTHYFEQQTLISLRRLVVFSPSTHPTIL